MGLWEIQKKCNNKNRMVPPFDAIISILIFLGG
jgi:hypothetical protein